jgi:polyhydroxybutyrate depolymerase
MDIRQRGARYPCLVHISSNYHPQKPLLLVALIHGASDIAKDMEKYFGFSDLANRENFIVMYPSGMGILGFFQHRNVGHCCGKAASDNADDVGDA